MEAAGSEHGGSGANMADLKCSMLPKTGSMRPQGSGYV
ncbi:hypothetical protein Z947_648 [Sulfitobacter geojensis]|nr:hypothetical protein Z947_648 [Sulfitobacter geojensis]